MFRVCSSNIELNNVGLDEYGIQTNLKPIFLNMMTSKFIMLFLMQLFKYLCNLESLPDHLQLKLMKYSDNADVCDF
jgi:hypothetical protein